MQYTGYYINLDRATERRAALEAHLASRDPSRPYRRFPAMDGAAIGAISEHIPAGAIGCYHSHRAVLREQLDGPSHLHIIEDDARMARNAPSFLDQIIASGTLDQYDILFTDSAVPPHAAGARDYRRIYRDSIRRAHDGTVTSIAVTPIQYMAGTSSYLVNRASIQRLHDLLDAELERGPTLPIDLRIRLWREQGILRVACLFPFITTVRVGEFDSATDDGRGARSRLGAELLRYSFFVECDIALATALADRYLAAPPSADPWENLHMRIAGFNASDRYDPI